VEEALPYLRVLDKVYTFSKALALVPVYSKHIGSILRLFVTSSYSVTSSYTVSHHHETQVLTYPNTHHSKHIGSILRLFLFVYLCLFLFILLFYTRSSDFVCSAH